MQSTLDPWTRVRTVNDLPADEVISALQKEIRRGNMENAALLAYEMYDTSEALEQKLWDRLCVISIEDIGFGDVAAPVLINALSDMRQRFAYGEGDRALFAIHAVRYLATREKDRGSDELINWIKLATAHGDVAARIPDYAIDMHTARGQTLGRGAQHFWGEGAHISPEMANRDTRYRAQLLALLDEHPTL